jgi:hypothetical protein
MDSFFKSIGDTLNIVGKVLVPQAQLKKEDKDNKQAQQIQQTQPKLAVAGLGLNNNLKPKGAAASVASTGMF